MPVTKTTRECYEVRDGRRGGDWANITLACWDSPPQPGYTRTSMYYGGEIQIHSSFGSWGHSWSSCAVPFKRFLMGAEFDYVFTKFMGTKLDRFDGEASAREVLKWIIEDRRRNGMSKAEAREAWDAFDDVRSMAECGEHDFGTAMMDVARSLDWRHPMHDNFADPRGWPRATKYDVQAQGFWRQLWPLFIEALKTEAEQSALQAA